MPDITLYAGCYTPEEGDAGLHVLTYNPKGGLQVVHRLAGVQNPSFLALHGGRLYAACEEAHAARAACFTLEDARAPRPLYQTTGPGAGTCHIAPWPQDGYVSCANYTSGNLFTFTAADGCVVGGLASSGSGPDKERQAGPHLHSVNFAPGGEVFVCDLGADKLLCYTTAPDGTLTASAAQPALALKPGSGPRHMAFAPGGRHAYVACELSCEIAVLELSAGGLLTQVQAISTRGTQQDGSTAAELCLSADGAFLYASTRGEDSIAAYAVDPESGKLETVGITGCGGSGPRHFTLLPGGGLLAVANEHSGTIALIERDQKSGALREVVDLAAVPHCVCVVCGEDTP